MIKCNYNMIKWDHKSDQRGSSKLSNEIINIINWDHENYQMKSWTWLNGTYIIIDTYIWCMYNTYVILISVNIEKSLLFIFSPYNYIKKRNMIVNNHINKIIISNHYNYIMKSGMLS